MTPETIARLTRLAADFRVHRTPSLKSELEADAEAIETMVKEWKEMNAVLHTIARAPDYANCQGMAAKAVGLVQCSNCGTVTTKSEGHSPCNPKEWKRNP